MKKLFFTLVVGLLSLSATAQTPGFFQNKNDEWVIEGSVRKDGKSADELRSVAKSWAITLGQVVDNPLSKDVIAAGAMHLGTAVNPFAGSWTEYLQHQCTIKVEDSKITYTFSSLLLRKTYSGYGVKQEQLSISELFTSIEKEAERVAAVQADASINKKDKKKQIDQIKSAAEAAKKSFAKMEKAVAKDLAKLNDLLR